MRTRACQAGFTLIEMMVTVAIVAIIASLVAPSFSDTLDQQRLKTKVSDIVDVLEFAKSEAMKRSSVSVAITRGASWSVAAQVNGVSAKSVSYDATNGCTMAAPSDADKTVDFSFRGVVSNYVNSNITIQSAKGRQVRIVINPIGRVTACAVSGGLPGYPSC